MREHERAWALSRTLCRAPSLQAHPPSLGRLARLPPYPTLTCSPLPTDASSSPRIVSLNGDSWRFQLFERPEAVPAAFPEPSFDTAGWPQARAAALHPCTVLRPRALLRPPAERAHLLSPPALLSSPPACTQQLACSNACT